MNRKFPLILAGLAALGLAVALAVPLFVPTTALRAEIERRVTAATGRAFRINGAFAFTLFPNLGLTARDVTLANAPGGRARNLATVETMRIAVRLAPLFSGRIEATQIDLDKPRIALEVDAQGRENWKLTPADPESARHLAMPAAALFSGVAIHDGAVSYDNARLGLHRAIDALDAKVEVTRLDRPAGISGAVSYLGRRLAYTGTVGTIETLLRGQPTHADLGLSSGFLAAHFTGDVSEDGTAAGDGTLRTPSLKDLAAWLGHPISAGSGLGPLDARGRIVAKDQRVALSQVVARLDAMRIGGALQADLRGKLPVVAGRLAIDRLDLNTYLRLDGPPPAPGANTNPGPNPVVAPPHSPGPSGPPSGGWSKAPIRLDLIKLLNGHLTLDAGGVAVRHLKLGKTTIAVTLADGLMTAQLAPVQLYGGSGQALLTADARGPVPLFANRLVFGNIAMAPFLADALGVDKVAGIGSLALDVTSKGASPDAIMRAMQGKGAVAVGHGSIHGVDMGRVARTVETILSAGATGDGAVTPFDRFGGSFVIADGILSNNDLRLTSDFVNMTGQGRLDLGNQTIVYRIEPKAALGGRMHLLDVGVPFAITGSWAHLTYTPDLAGAVTGLVTSVLGKGTAPLLDLLGGFGGSGQKTPPARQKKSNAVGDRLKSLFGLH